MARRVRVIESPFPGCFLLQAAQSSDARGSFTKLISVGPGYEDGIPDALSLGEVFLTRSRLGVLRGMHLQEPPFDQHKLVYCLEGLAYDVLVDLRRGSPTESLIYASELSPDTAQAILVPPGVAHGFLALADATSMLYCTTRPYSPEHDSGVRWDSIGARWPRQPDTVSARDLGLPALGQYVSPFRY